MIIKTITCHDVYNLGASLQAYALQTYLQKQGHEVEIIDYKPDYLSGHFNLWGVYNPVFDKPFIKQLYLLAKLPGRLLALRRKKVFDTFTKKYLHLTRRYHSNDELKKDPPMADAYIAGSDQIWNTAFKNGRDPAFYLDFAPKDKLRLSYAASLATKEIAEKYRPFVSQMIKSLDYVSVREKSSLSVLQSLGRSDAVAVCDPVFLLSKEEWSEMCIDMGLESNKYLLVYDFDNNPVVEQIAKEIAKAKGLGIYNVGPFWKSYARKNFVYAGPLEFLSLVKDADYIISNSFHATAFSLIFQKQFCVVKRKEAINERMVSLLADLGLNYRVVSGYEDRLLSLINYDNVMQICNENVNSSKLYMNIALAKIQIHN